MRIRRILLFAVAVVVILGLGAPYMNADGYRARIQEALERALNRKVEVGKVHFNLFTGPGFTVENVIIMDDPNIGIEPLANVETLEARVRLTSLWTRKIAFSNLRLKAPTVNLVKSDHGVWNFQLLLNRASSTAADTHDFPSIQVRTGRICFKFGDFKSVFYVNDADLDVTAIGDDKLNVRFEGEPSRNDRSAQSFGRMQWRGTWKHKQNAPGELDLYAELERSAVSEVVKLIEGRSIGLHGIVAAKARISGPINNLQITGTLKLDDIHRWDLLPSKGGFQLSYKGTLDVPGQKLELETTPAENSDLPILVRFSASSYLANPRWSASVDLRDVPAGTFIEVARHMGAPLPEGILIDGKLNGVIGYARPGGLGGKLALADSSLKMPNAVPVRFQRAELVIDNQRLTIGPSTILMNDDQSADLEATYLLDRGAVDMKISTDGMKVAELLSGTGKLVGAATVPLLEICRQGTWKGWVRYARSEEANGAWTGEFDVRDVRMELPGIAEPVRVTSASVAIDGDKVALTKLRAHAGKIALDGDYRYDAASTRPHRLRLDIPEADLAEVERLLMPTLQRRPGLLARLRFRSAPLPDWLKSRHIDGTLHIGSLTAGDQRWSIQKARLVWDGPNVRLSAIEASTGDADAKGLITADLSAAAPKYHIAGKVGDLDYKGGSLALEGKIDTRGVGAELLVNAKADGTFAAQDINFSTEADFHTISGGFELLPGARLRLNALQAAQGVDTYVGQGSLQADGRVLLELTTGRKQVRLVGSLIPPQPPVAR